MEWITEVNEMVRIRRAPGPSQKLLTLFAAALFLTALGGSGQARAGGEESGPAAEPPATETDSTLIKRGAEIGDSPTVTLAEVVRDPEKFSTEPVIMQGTIAEVCQTKGCWMKVVPDTSETGVRVTFKDYGFFVPTTSMGWLVRAEGVFHVKVWTKEEADHLEGEGAKLTRNDDGTATEIGFVATGVELRKPEDEPAGDSAEAPDEAP
jgi:hypothetical protein